MFLPGSIFTPQTSAFYTLVPVRRASKLDTTLDSDLDRLHLNTLSDVLSCFLNNQNFCPCYLPKCENDVIVNMHDFSLRWMCKCSNLQFQAKKKTNKKTNKTKNALCFLSFLKSYYFSPRSENHDLHSYPSQLSIWLLSSHTELFFIRANTSAPRWGIVWNGWYWWDRQAASWELICKEYRCKEKEKRQVGTCDGWRGYTVDRWQENINS